MRTRTLWLASALLAALVVGATVTAADDAKDKKEAPPGKAGERGDRKDGPRGKGGFRGRGISVDQVVERLMAFDKNKDGKITKDELPDRMQNLIAQGDTNKDGALDKDEVKKLAAKIANEGPRGFGGFGGRGPDAFRGGPPRSSAERALEDLRLSDQKKKDAAESAVKAYQENVRKLTDLARAEMLLKMKDVLSDAEYKKFKDNLDSPPGPPPRRRPR
jgi:hypothetical protein